MNTIGFVAIEQAVNYGNILPFGIDLKIVLAGVGAHKN